MKELLNDALSLYRECFKVYGNEPEIIIKHAVYRGKVFLYFENRQAVNMICTSRITDGDFDAEYIFAVCTKPEHRGKGIFRNRLEEVIGDTPCVLIPENESLFAFYERFGFSPIYSLEAEIDGKSNIPKCEITPEELYGVYQKCFQFPKKPQKLFIASLNAHIEYGGKIFTDGKSAVLVYEGDITDVYAPSPEEAIKIAISVADGKAKAIFPTDCENALIAQGINYEKKKTAMGRNLQSYDIYINTLFN